MGAASPTILVQSPSPVVSSTLATGGGGQWRIEDEIDANYLPFGSETMIPVCIDDIESLSSASNGLLIQCNNAHRRYLTTSDSAPGRRGSFAKSEKTQANWFTSDVATVIVTGTLKHTVVATSSMFLLENDKLFEYVRGAAMSGYVFYCCLLFIQC